MRRSRVQIRLPLPLGYRRDVPVKRSKLALSSTLAATLLIAAVTVGAQPAQPRENLENPGFSQDPTATEAAADDTVQPPDAPTFVHAATQYGDPQTEAEAVGAADAEDPTAPSSYFPVAWGFGPLVQSPPSMGNAARPPEALPKQLEPLEQVEEGQSVLLRTLLGLLIVLALAWLAAHPRVIRAEKALGFEHVIGAGLPFVLLGLLLKSSWIGVLDENVLHHLAPLFEFGLGWLGFLVGFRFNVRFLDKLPRGMPTVIGVTTSVPFVMVFLVCGGMMLAFTSDAANETVVRDAIVIAAASAMTAARAIQTKTYGAFNSGDNDIVSLTEQLDEIAAVIALLFLTAYFRPEGDAQTWHLPGTAWIFIALGMGVALGIVIHIMLRQRATSSEFLAITLGSVAFAAGMADYLWLSPIVVCFIAGAMVANLPLAHPKEQLFQILSRVEWPLYLVFLTCVGAFWDITDVRGWLLVPAFVVARLIGKWLSIAVLSRTEIDQQYDGLRAGRTVFARLSGLSIALVVGWESLYGGPSGRWIVTAVVGGAIVLELLAQFWERTSERWLRVLRAIGSASPLQAPSPSEANAHDASSAEDTKR